MNEKNIQVTVSDQLKAEAEEILAKQGLTPEEVIKMLYRKIVVRGTLPTELLLTAEEEDIRFSKLTEKIPVERLNTYEEIEAWLNEE
ncbi:type II toxin-antitoxin system RelB/DinJ family antitoxin [Ligilactobacillus sp. Marseille-Q7487]|jgi:addiction module RelB/DinJ family antitoxin|uniref:type II toxin-antitoxin system RelB/DinJ family antitoxin n=1 Tax=Ligilactobacillus sp. Marseille-Q7487 TaxID=3022128 RepID=UPI0015B4B59D|nr:type II toxin-antitoxin system RelB/DinJ family antitoxin [Ligilactobacillus sp. Marseille-Q7487]